MASKNSTYTTQYSSHCDDSRDMEAIIATLVNMKGPFSLWKQMPPSAELRVALP